MCDIISQSCNVGIIKAIKRIRKKDFYNTLKRFQFGKKTGVLLPGETEGIMRPLSKWSGLSKYSIAIGHEISVTSLQLAAAFSAIANGGIYIAPSIIESIENHDGTVIRGFSPKVRGRIIKKSIAKRLMKMMRGVVKNGTGVKASSAYFGVVGKTGTSKKYFRESGYSDSVISSFIGIAPFINPEVCILVVVDDPADRLSGGKIATPVFANIIDRILIQKGIKKREILAEPPLRLSKRRSKFDGKTMPDFKLLRLSESARLLIDIKRIYGINYSILGTGRVYSQRPEAGRRLNRNIKIVLYLK